MLLVQYIRLNVLINLGYINPNVNVRQCHFLYLIIAGAILMTIDLTTAERGKKPLQTLKKMAKPLSLKIACNVCDSIANE